MSFIYFYESLLIMMENAFYFILKALFVLKGALSGLRQLLATESPLKMIKNAFCFTLKALFFKRFLFFGHVE